MLQSVIYQGALWTLGILLEFVDVAECNLPRCFMDGGYFVRIHN